MFGMLQKLIISTRTEATCGVILLDCMKKGAQGLLDFTVSNTVISPNFLVWKFYGKTVSA